MIRDNIEDVQRRIKEASERSGRIANDVTLIAVTKGLGINEINEAIACGITNIGENRVQEAMEKRDKICGIRWHMVGHLQRNKVKDAVQIFDVIHSVDSIELADELNRRSSKKMDMFIQINISGETTKFGINPEELSKFIDDVRQLENLNLKGLMTIAPLVSDPEQARPYFRTLRLLKAQINCTDLSMGMSNDFEVAIEEGSTYVRIGTAIFKK